MNAQAIGVASVYDSAVDADEKPDRMLLVAAAALLAMIGYWVVTWFVPMEWLPF